MNQKSAYLPLILFCIAFAWQASSLQGANKLTPEQIEKVHSRLFHNRGPVGQLADMLSNGTGDVHLLCIVPVWQRIAFSFADELTILASKSDLIVVARAGAGTSHLTNDKDFLYSDWTFTVEDVLNDNPAASVRLGTTILVSRVGGQLQIEGRMVYANCADFREFTGGQQYLLFLSYVPETGAYTTNGTAAFALSSVRRLDEFHFHAGEITDKSALLKTARDAVLSSTKIPHS